MSPERWNALTPKQRKEAVVRHDASGIMRQPRWAPLLEEMSRPYEQLTNNQQAVVKDLP